METPGNNKADLIKVVIKLEGDHAIESLWAEPVSDTWHRLRNVPLLAYGYSEQDVVEVVAVDDRLVVREVVERGGHSTYRLFFKEPTNDEKFRPLWEPFGKLACTYERGNSRLIGIDVPPEADVYAVYSLL